ncbi:hypothetical protein [Acinetobacter rudis]|uniref:Lipoprotein n=1 Tax=Acinetobacter rudis TaxID=632955 RepID=A0AAW8J7Y3_9GAMM|nr:hypothetical protein [Acinetobacter rudis]MDQ8936177.1 hypothetical protein [Acinetobacter rudis]MDQ8954118.1 hypothetical protein [Acinetobacter rudis]MDQ9018465.1 hypothetical protein [Acinetobacter rudis]
MFKLNIMSVLCVCVALSACQTTTVSKDVQYTGQDARIRLYGQNQKPTIMTYEQAGKKIKINVGGGLGDAFSSMVGSVKNSHIGIAQTQTSLHFQDQNGLLSKAFYQEFVIPAATAVSVRNGFIGLTNISASPQQTTVQYQGSCRGAEMTFFPKAGKDYEVVANRKGAACGVSIFEVDRSGNTQEISLK